MDKVVMHKFRTFLPLLRHDLSYHLADNWGARQLIVHAIGQVMGTTTC